MAHDSHPSGDSDEPKSPLWLPALGAVLFLVVGIWWVTRTPEPKPASTLDAGATVVAGDAAAGDAGAAPPPAAEAH